MICASLCMCYKNVSVMITFLSLESIEMEMKCKMKNKVTFFKNLYII